MRKTIYKNDGTIPTAYAEIRSTEKIGTVISEKHDITVSSWLSGDQILKFAQITQNELGRANYLIIDPLIFQIEEQLVDYLNANITQSTEFIIAIIHWNGNHWITGLINLNQKTTAVLDSLGETNHNRLFNKIYKVADVALTLQNKHHTFGEFKFRCSLDNPKQENYDDCGVMVCKTISSVLNKDRRKFEIRTGDFRDEIVRTLDNVREIHENRARVPITKTINRFKQPSYSNKVNGYRVLVQITDYEQLIENFF